MTTATQHPDLAAALRGRHLLMLEDHSAEEIRYLIDLAAAIGSIDDTQALIRGEAGTRITARAS